MVEPTGSQGVQIGDVIVGSTIKYEDISKSNTSGKYDVIDDADDGNGKYYVQLGEELFDGDLEKGTGADKFGRTSIKWTYENDEIGTYAEKPDEVYVGAVEVGTIYDDLGLDDTVATSKIEQYVDSDTKKGTADYAIEEDGEDEYGDAGQTVYVYYTPDDSKTVGDEEKVVISVISSYLGVVADDDYTKDGKDGILVSVLGGTDIFYETSAYQNDDVLLLNIADDEIQAILGEPETVTGSVTRRGATDYALTIDGTKYEQAAQFSTGDGDVIDGINPTAITLGSDAAYTLYVDANGAYLAVVEDEDNAQKDLVYVYNVEKGTTLNGTKLEYSTFATVVYMDGTTEILAVGETASSETIPGYDTFKGMEGTIVTLSYDEDEDQYDLETALEGNYQDAKLHTSLELAADDKYAKLDNASNYYLTGSTVYIFVKPDSDEPTEIDTVELVTGGIDYEKASGVKGSFAYGSDKEVDYVVIEDADGYTAASKDVIYISDKNAQGTVDGGVLFNGYYVGESREEVEIPVYSVNGNKTELNTNRPTANAFYTYSERSDGTLALTKVNGEDEGSYTGTVASIYNSMITLDGKTPYDASNAVVVDVTDLDETVSTEDDFNAYGKAITSLSALKRVVDNDNYGDVTVTMYVNSDDEVVGIFITKVAAGA